MPRGATLTNSLAETLLLVQRALTVVLSGHNAFYFATYLTRHGKRKFGAFVLIFINLAIGAESLAFGLQPWTGAGIGRTLAHGSQMVAASLSLAVALAIAVLILRQSLRRR